MRYPALGLMLISGLAATLLPLRGYPAVAAPSTSTHFVGTRVGTRMSVLGGSALRISSSLAAITASPRSDRIPWLAWLYGPEPARYLYVWAGDDARVKPDFLAVINSDESSSSYGK